MTAGMDRMNKPLAQSPSLTHPIVFFDGECVMCNTFLDWMLAIDREAKLRVAPLQGTTAAELLPPLPTNPEDWSIYYLDGRSLYAQSEAVLQIVEHLGGSGGGPWQLLRLGRGLPLGWRDGLYRLVASHRYQILGKRETCRLPSPEQQQRFLP